MNHYFSTPTGDFEPSLVQAKFWETDWEFYTAPGVFSGHGLDIGTAVLLRTCPPPNGAMQVLDLGCGFGLISVALAVANPELQVTAIDVNARALELTRLNAEKYGVANRVQALTPETVPDDLIFDQIWSNPPIRIGKSALHQLLLRWLARLHTQGVANLVVGKNLGADSLQRWLSAQSSPSFSAAEGRNYTCEKLASAKGFRVFTVRP